ncbi:unnamed protein product [Ambrosiozyma monospora]|uniref:Unnamed protein product n=1 Tax=Ambrosiozyma monospora TaxID=43982 RepID=A0A9W6Z4A9_AMBMO|nr:unnamed protein product [Ambrosiozyma monospora]
MVLPMPLLLHIRQLYSLAERGFAPKVFSKCNSKGIPVYAVLVVVCFSLLSLLQLGKNSAVVLNWIVSLCTGAQLINYGWMCFIYIGFYRALKAQGIDRESLPYRSWFQPYSIYICTFFVWIDIFVIGYTVFLPGWWKVSDFLFSYLMIFVNVGLFVFWKLFKRTKFKNPAEVDLTSGLEEVQKHEEEILAEEGGQDHSKDSWFSKAMSWVF